MDLERYRLRSPGVSSRLICFHRSVMERSLHVYAIHATQRTIVLSCFAVSLSFLPFFYTDVTSTLSSYNVLLLIRDLVIVPPFKQLSTSPERTWACAFFSLHRIFFSDTEFAILIKLSLFFLVLKIGHCYDRVVTEEGPR